MQGKGSAVILITGATGSIGRALTARLGGRADVEFRTATRDSGAKRAANHVTMDFADAASVAAALRDVDVVFLNSSQHPDMAALQGTVVEAAREAGVRHIVKVSSGNAFTGPDKPSWVGRAHADVEARIAASGMGWTFLRPRYFMQNLLGLAGPISAGTLPVALADERLAPVDVRDIADVAATILTSPDEHDARVYDLSGPESLTFGDVAKHLTDVLGTPVAHVTPTLQALVASLADAGAPGWQQLHIVEGMTIFATDGSVAEVSPDVELVTGHPAITIERFITDHKAAFAAGNGHAS
ncbi:NAD(P)H dehydrogenase (quinone) [Catenulispora sp. GAS73]